MSATVSRTTQQVLQTMAYTMLFGLTLEADLFLILNFFLNLTTKFVHFCVMLDVRGAKWRDKVLHLLK